MPPGHISCGMCTYANLEIAEVGSFAVPVTVGILQWAGYGHQICLKCMHTLAAKRLEEKNVKCIFIVQVTFYCLLMQQNSGAGPMST